MIPLEIPSGMASRQTGRLSRRFSRRRRRVFPRRRKYQVIAATESACARTVAAAAPRTPQPNVKMNSGSSAMFSSAPAIMLPMAKRGLPSTRTRLDRPMLSIWNGAPSRMIAAYCAVRARFSGVAPNARSTGSKNSRPSTQTNRPAPPCRVNRFPSARRPSSGFPSPNLIAVYAPTPAPIRLASDRITVTTGEVTAAAALPRYPTPCPINTWSTRLYSALTSMHTTDGSANRSSSLPTGSVPMGFGAACFSCSMNAPLSPSNSNRNRACAAIPAGPVPVFSILVSCSF